jgi:PleD family two-component response regulator
MTQNSGTHESTGLGVVPYGSARRELANAGEIIVVDDDPSIREIVTRYLEENNVRVRVCPERSCWIA